MTRYSTARVGAGIPRPGSWSRRLGGEYPPLRARYCADLRCPDLKVESKPGAGAKITLSTPVKNHSQGREVIDEDGEII